MIGLEAYCERKNSKSFFDIFSESDICKHLRNTPFDHNQFTHGNWARIRHGVPLLTTKRASVARNRDVNRKKAPSSKKQREKVNNQKIYTSGDKNTAKIAQSICGNANPDENSLSEQIYRTQQLVSDVSNETFELDGNKYEGMEAVRMKVSANAEANINENDPDIQSAAKDIGDMGRSIGMQQHEGESDVAFASRVFLSEAVGGTNSDDDSRLAASFHEAFVNASNQAKINVQTEDSSNRVVAHAKNLFGDVDSAYYKIFKATCQASNEATQNRFLEPFTTGEGGSGIAKSIVYSTATVGDNVLTEAGRVGANLNFPEGSTGQVRSLSNVVATEVAGLNDFHVAGTNAVLTSVNSALESSVYGKGEGMFGRPSVIVGRTDVGNVAYSAFGGIGNETDTNGENGTVLLTKTASSKAVVITRTLSVGDDGRYAIPDDTVYGDVLSQTAVPHLGKEGGLGTIADLESASHANYRDPFNAQETEQQYRLNPPDKNKSDEENAKRPGTFGYSPVDMAERNVEAALGLPVDYDWNSATQPQTYAFYQAYWPSMSAGQRATAVAEGFDPKNDYISTLKKVPTVVRTTRKSMWVPKNTEDEIMSNIKKEDNMKNIILHVIGK